MNRRELRRKLLQEGFVSVHFGKHETFEKNGIKIQIPTSGKQLNWRLEKQIMIDIRKASNGVVSTSP